MITGSDIIVGYKKYIDSIKDLTGGKQTITSGMRKEIERCSAAVDAAVSGSVVALISSGDAGIYGMAGLALEMITKQDPSIAVEIIPGVTAAGSVGARLGAPLMLDFACISLSDLLVEWTSIVKRLEAVASADLVTALYNPRSTKRKSQLVEAVEIFKKYRSGSVPVGIGTSVGTDEETIVITDLDHLLEADVNMRSIVVIGNTTSKVINNWLITPRGYQV